MRLPKDLIAEARRVAAQRNTTVTALIRDALAKETSGGREYEAAMKRQLALMDAGLRLSNEGEPYPDRGSLHER